MKEKSNQILALLFLLGLVLSACTTTPIPENAQPTDTPVFADASEPTLEAVVEAPMDAPLVETTSEEAASPTEGSSPPEIKTGLVATDPGSVTLNSGRNTLVEFFAFW